MMTIVNFRDLHSPESQAETRQNIVRCLWETISQTGSGLKNLPYFIEEAFDSRVWEYERIFDGGSHQGPISFHDFITKHYPVGLGTTTEIILALLASSGEKGAAERAHKLIDHEMRRGPGNPRIAEQPRNEDGTVGAKDRTVDNIHGSAAPLDKAPDRPAGTAIDAGLRRLQKAAEAGDSRATMWLDDVLAGKCSTHRACIEMGWRKPTVTVRDDADALADAACKKAGPIDTAMRAWRKMTMEDQERFLEWAGRNMRGVIE